MNNMSELKINVKIKPTYIVIYCNNCGTIIYRHGEIDLGEFSATHYSIENMIDISGILNIPHDSDFATECEDCGYFNWNLYIEYDVKVGRVEDNLKILHEIVDNINAVPINRNNIKMSDDEIINAFSKVLRNKQGNKSWKIT